MSLVGFCCKSHGLMTTADGTMTLTYRSVVHTQLTWPHFNSNKPLHMWKLASTILVIGNNNVCLPSSAGQVTQPPLSKPKWGYVERDNFPETSYAFGAAALRGSGSWSGLIKNDSAALCLSFTHRAKWPLRLNHEKWLVVRQRWKKKLNLYFLLL